MVGDGRGAVRSRLGDANDGFTFDFDEWTDPIPLIHYCFRVGQEDFSGILERIKAAGIPFRSNVHGPVDFQVNTRARRQHRLLE